MKSKTQKTAKNSKCFHKQINRPTGSLGGIGGWPPISPWINRGIHDEDENDQPKSKHESQTLQGALNASSR